MISFPLPGPHPGGWLLWPQDEQLTGKLADSFLERLKANPRPRTA
jgi:hypothetical protein